MPYAENTQRIPEPTDSDAETLQNEINTERRRLMHLAARLTQTAHDMAISQPSETSLNALDRLDDIVQEVNAIAPKLGSAILKLRLNNLPHPFISHAESTHQQ